MLNTKQVKKFAEQIHKMQRLKSGKKYFGHCLRVCELSESLFYKDIGCDIITADTLIDLEIIKQAAYLHDSLEDRCDEGTLVQVGVDPRVITAVKLLTKDDSYLEADYFERIRNNRYARIVKMADLQHNSMLSRIPVEESFLKIASRQHKYLKQYYFLLTNEWKS